MKYDYVSLYDKNAAFLRARPRLKKAVIFFNKYVSILFFTGYFLLWVYGAFIGDFAPKDFTKIFFVPMLALVIVSFARLAIDKPRPYDERGAGITPLREKKSKSNSFPSRHLTCATVIATTFLPYLPIIGGVFLVLSLGLAYSRFALGWHYPSDLIAGFLLGIAVGSAIFFL